MPPQHGLELLTVYAWEQGGQNPQFNMAEGFRTVLELIVQYRQLCVYWTINYSAEDKTIGDFLKMQLRKPRFGHPPPRLPYLRSMVPTSSCLLKAEDRGRSCSLELGGFPEWCF